MPIIQNLFATHPDTKLISFLTLYPYDKTILYCKTCHFPSYKNTDLSSQKSVVLCVSQLNLDTESISGNTVSTLGNLSMAKCISHNGIRFNWNWTWKHNARLLRSALKTHYCFDAYGWLQNNTTYFEYLCTKDQYLNSIYFTVMNY